MAPETWTEVRVDVPLGWQELACDLLRIEDELTARIGVDDGDEDEIAPEHERVRVFLPARLDNADRRSAIRRALAQSGIDELTGLEPRFLTGEGRDWNAVWKASWKPFRIGRICVVPPWDERALRPSDLRLELVPGGVFGTGRHATTRHCLRFLQERVAPGERIIDAGCGSGILGVAAGLLGASEVIGFDLDPGGAPAANELARANGVGERCLFERSDLADRDDRGFAGLVANIYADVLIARMEKLAAALEPGAWFILSGIENRHYQGVLAAIGPVGLALEEERSSGRWHTLAGRREA